MLLYKESVFQQNNQLNHRLTNWLRVQGTGLNAQLHHTDMDV